MLVLVGYSFILLIDKVLIDSHDHNPCEHEIQQQQAIQTISNVSTRPKIQSVPNST